MGQVLVLLQPPRLISRAVNAPLPERMRMDPHPPQAHTALALLSLPLHSQGKVMPGGFSKENFN